jgi:hypothetical protein
VQTICVGQSGKMKRNVDNLKILINYIQYKHVLTLKLPFGSTKTAVGDAALDEVVVAC